MKHATIKIKPVPGTTLAESKDQARKIREDRLLPAIEAGRHVRLDFSEVTFTTQSFVHALISEAIRRRGEQIFEQLDFHGCTDDVQQIVLTVVDYTMQAHEAALGKGGAAIDNHSLDRSDPD